MKKLSLLISILFCLSISANDRKISFHHLNLEDGLSNVSITDIWPDPTGIIWIASTGGLDCYDGNSFTRVCPPLEIQPHSTKLFVRQIVGDEKGHLYVLYTRHICVLDTNTGDYKLLYSGICNCITYNEGLWIGHKNNLLHSTGPDDPVKTVYSISPDDGNVTAILRTADGNIWLGTSSGKVLFLKKDFSSSSENMAEGKLHSQIYRIFEDSNKTIWIGTLQDGVMSISKDGKRTTYRHDICNNRTISSNYVRDFCEDNLGNIWIGTYTGLDCLNTSTGRITQYHSGMMRHDAISHSSVWAIKKDQQGTLWVGTYYGGINYFNPEYNIYNRYPVSNKEGNGLSAPITSKVLADKEGNIWVATEGGGLNHIDRKTGKTTWYNTSSAPGRRLSENNIKDMIYVPQEDAIYVGIHLGGVNRIDVRTGKVRQYRNMHQDKDEHLSESIRNLADYGDSLIIRTKSSVYIMDKKTGHDRPVRPLNDYLSQGGHIRILFLDKDKNLWIHKSFSNKLVKLAPPYIYENEYTPENTKGDYCSGEISSMMQDESGKIWLASADKGFYVYSTSSDTFTLIGEDTTLKGANDMVESPSSGNIICSSEDGFVIFNPVTHKVIRYGKANGFPLKNSMTQCVAITNNSEIFIGGYGGLVSVSENDLDIQEKPYRLFFTSLSINGEKVEIGSDILSGSLLNTTAVTLPADTRSIELFFSSSNHISVTSNPIEYKLIGFDKNWNRIKGDRKILYTNLPSGKYRLQLRPSDNVPEEICPTTELMIKIRTPWYATWIAICIYILLAVVVIIFILNSYTNTVQMREYVRYEKERAADLESLNQAKLRFFTNISHEIRTPLTIIIAEIESIIQKHNLTPTLYKKVLGIYKNGLSLRELISELMEFRKQEEGQLQIRVAPHNLVFFINEFFLLFNEYAESKGIRLSLIKETERLEVWYDQIQMQKTLNNILSNSIKFTPKGGSITIKIYSTDASAVIEISDTGKGIPKDDLKKIFDRFYQVDYTADINTGTGIGLALALGIVKMHSGTIDVESTEGNGSLFRITLPLGYSHFTKEQLSDYQKASMDINIADKFSVPAGQTQHKDTNAAKSHTVVIAEDNQGILDMLIELFSPIYNVIPATDGKSALDAVRKHIPSLVVSDVIMPEISGTYLCKSIKNDPTLCHIPVVLLTARVEVEQNMEGLQQGADDYITKPFNSTLLLSRCNNLVNSRIMLQEKYSKESGQSTWIAATNRLDNDFLEKVQTIVYKNLDNEGFDLNGLIKSIGMSRTVFFRKLKAVSGQTPTEFIQTIRIKKGAELLQKHPEMNIGEISDAIGFNTPKYFAKCFKEHYGKSPFAWRKDAIKNN